MLISTSANSRWLMEELHCSETDVEKQLTVQSNLGQMPVLNLEKRQVAHAPC